MERRGDRHDLATRQHCTAKYSDTGEIKTDSRSIKLRVTRGSRLNHRCGVADILDLNDGSGCAESELGETHQLIWPRHWIHKHPLMMKIDQRRQIGQVTRDSSFPPFTIQVHLRKRTNKVQRVLVQRAACIA